MDVFNTAFLIAVVEDLKLPQSWLLDRYFPTVVQSDTEEIKFDVKGGKRRIAPFVSPLLEGKLVESLGYTTKTFKPAYIKDKRVFDPEQPLKRAAGERIGGSGSPMNRLQSNLVTEMADQTEMIIRRLETMAVEVLRTGKVTVTGEGYDTVVVDFGRTAGHTVTLSGASRWGQAGIKPLDNLDTWTNTVLQNSGAGIVDVVMDPDAWKLFAANTEVKELLDTRRGSTARIETTNTPRIGAQYKGQVGHYDFYTYQDWYVNDAGSEVAMLPSNTVLMGSSAVEGIRHFGAIRDEKAGYQPQQMFPKSWTTEDPAVRYLMMQSAPLLVPYRPDATFAVTVN
jgi:hypothetical protein